MAKKKETTPTPISTSQYPLPIGPQKPSTKPPVQQTNVQPSLTLPPNKGISQQGLSLEEQKAFNDYFSSSPTGGVLTPAVQAAIEAHKQAGIRAQTQAELSTAMTKAKVKEELTPPNVSPEQLGQVGVLTPEQQAVVNANPEMPMGNILGQTAISGIKGAVATGAATGTAIGLGLAPATMGTSIPLGAAAGAIVGGVSGITYGFFASITHEKKENVELIDQNVNRAIYNIGQANRLVNMGGDTETAIQQFNDAKAELLFAETQYKAQSGAYDWATGIRLKQTYLQTYLSDTLPIMQARFYISLQKPNPAYIDYGLDTNGDPVEQ